MNSAYRSRSSQNTQQKKYNPFRRNGSQMDPQRKNQGCRKIQQ